MSEKEVNFEIQIPQQISHKYLQDYPIPEIILKIERMNGQFVATKPVIIDVESIIQKLEHSKK